MISMKIVETSNFMSIVVYNCKGDRQRALDLLATSTLKVDFEFKSLWYDEFDNPKLIVRLIK